MNQSKYHANNNFNSKATPEAILRPVNPWFVFFTLLVALMLNLLPWGAWEWVPDWLALILLFWAAREPHLIGFGVAFILGLCMDTHNASVMGEHPFGYILLVFAGSILSKRLPSFDSNYQTLHIFPILVITHLFIVMLHTLFGNAPFPGWDLVLLSPVLTALLWPITTWLMLVPQRRPINIDLNRPL